MMRKGVKELARKAERAWGQLDSNLKALAHLAGDAPAGCEEEERGAAWAAIQDCERTLRFARAALLRNHATAESAIAAQSGDGA
jgi:hypothetical protein